MKKITSLILFALLLATFSWQADAQTTYTGSTGAIPDNACPAQTLFTAMVGNAGTIGAGSTLNNVTINVTHTWDADLQISLVSPSGTTLDLTSGNGGSGDNYTNTVFQDGSPIITTGTPPFTGTFRAEGGTFASTFAGQSITGNWRLSICDNALGDAGTVNSWSITITSPAPPPPPPVTVNVCGTGNPQPIPVTGTGGNPCLGGPTTSPANVTATGIIGTMGGQYVLDQVVINLTHTFDGDLDISLISPMGTTLDLSSDNGGAGDNYTNTVFNDSGVTIVGATAPFTGTFRPEGGLFATVFAGQSITGNWRLSICDDAGGDVGSLTSYCIRFVPNVIIVGNAPNLACPSDVMENTDPGVCSGIVNFATPNAVDIEDGVIPATQTMGPPSGSMFPQGDTVVEFSATDSDGNTVTCDFTVTIMDMEAPIAVCQNITVELDPITGMASITPADIDNGSTDNCGIATRTLSMSTFGCSNIGDNTVTLTVTDTSGNSSTCTAVVTVEDNTAPVITCVGQPGSVIGSSSASPALAIVDNTTVSTTLVVTDNFEITDLDVSLNINHTWVADMTITLQSPAGTQVVIYDGTADGCSGDNIMDTYDDESANALVCAATADAYPLADYMPSNPLSAFDGENTAGTWTLSVADGAGGDQGVVNMWSLIYSYDVSAAPMDFFLDANGMVSILADDLIQSVDEACGFTVTVGGPATGGGGTTPGTLTTTFAGGNGSFGNMFDLNILNDLTIDSFDVNANLGTFDVAVYTKPGTWVGFDNDASAWTLVGNATGVVSNGPGVATPLNLSLNVPLTAGSTQAFYLVPTPNIFNYTNGTAVGNVFASDANMEFLEGGAKVGLFSGSLFSPRNFNGNIQYSVGEAAPPAFIDFDCSNLGENQVEIFVTDSSGNFSSCIATVNIIDNTAPIITCAGPTVPTLTGTVSDSPALAIIDNTTVSTTITVTDNFPLTDLNVALGVTHSWVADMQITLMSPAGTSVLIFDGGADGCSGDNFAFTLDDESANPLTGCVAGPPAFPLTDYMPSNALSAFDGENTMGVWTLSIEDTAGGDQGTLNNWGITYSYDGTPTVAFQIELGADGTTTIDPLSLIGTTIEACGIETAAASQTTFDCDDIASGIFQVTVFVSDASGNIASCIADVIVVDNLAPVITCPADQTVDPGAGNLFYTVPDYFATGEAIALDNCTSPVTITTQDPAPGATITDGVYTVTLTGEDQYGNVGTCSFQLTVESVLGINENGLDTAISMYPNPADSQVTLSNRSNILLDNATIYNINGKLVNRIDLRSMTSEKVIDVSNLAAGVYMVRITGETGTVVKRLIKK